MKASGVAKNAFVVAALTALSRVLGLGREMLQSRLIGAGVAQSAFALAFALPNMARKLFGEGALTAAFVPVFKSELENSSLEAAARLARSVMTTVVMILAAFVILAILGLDAFAAWRGCFDAPQADRFSLTFDLVRILLPYMIFICAAAFGMGVLNAFGRFKAASFVPSLLNICWIGALAAIWFFPGLEVALRIKIVAYAVLSAGALQMAFMFRMMAKKGILPYPSFALWRDPKFRLVWRNVAIGALGAGAIQLNYLLDQFLAQLAAPWAAGVIGYAERLMDLPLGIVGVSFGTVLLPTLSGHFAKDDLDGARAALVASLSPLLFVMVPAAAGLMVLAPEVTGFIYEGGEFDSVATLRVSRALAVYSAGLAFFGFQKVFVPWFQAQGDMKTPLRVSVCTVVLNAFLNIMAVLLLPVEWRHVGLAVSTVVCSGVGCLLLGMKARMKNGVLGLAAVLPRLIKIILASIVMACVIYLVKKALPIESCFWRTAILVPLGGGVYLAFSFLSGIRFSPAKH
ncbi:MAG: murein biosynthesis integral membrane protein MurJ [Kiritimatiellae bacterium]|nr:murein biosynthesis integral membrane protein MurJ [Kiritimatiellia bacterium]